MCCLRRSCQQSPTFLDVHLRRIISTRYAIGYVTASTIMDTARSSARMSCQIVSLMLEPPDGSPRLVLLEDTRGITAPYLALSHCWGGTIPYRTLMSNKVELCEGIEFSQLSKNFQDAVEVSRWLGFRYIWIDSFCIVQDDPRDWLKQSSEMATIYSGAILTISAARSANFIEGFLSSRHSDHLLPFSYKLPTGFGVYARRTADLEARHAVLGERAVIGLPGSSPLFERGWAFQERLLSPRVLHFTRSELIFECLQGPRCECGANGLPYRALKAHGGLKLDDAGNRNLSIHKQWCRLVEQFTRRRLANPLDILLPAFSAIARVQHGGSYLAGLRSDRLLVDLLWFSEIYPDTKMGTPFEPSRPGIYTAPSFSWASIIGPIECVHAIWIRDFCSEVEESYASLENPDDPYGRVKDGWIKTSRASCSGKDVVPIR